MSPEEKAAFRDEILATVDEHYMRRKDDRDIKELLGPHEERLARLELWVVLRTMLKRTDVVDKNNWNYIHTIFSSTYKLIEKKTVAYFKDAFEYAKKHDDVPADQREGTERFLKFLQGKSE